MRKAEDDGHVYLPLERLTINTSKLLELDHEDVESDVLNLVEEGELDREDEKVYLPRLLAMERKSVELLHGLIGSAPSLSLASSKIEKVLNGALDTGLVLSDEQTAALRCLLSGPVTVLTGGPGTGKTTITRWITRILLLHTSNIALAAPTGRAAKRLAESCRISAKTIHRLLRFDPDSRQFQHDSEEPLDADAVLIDEMSMVDLPLFHALLNALKQGTRLILIGDSDQLPSVGAGNDLIVNCGMFACGMTCSDEQLLMDAEIGGMCRRLAAGIEVTPETIAVDLIKQVGPQGEPYLTQEHTLERLRSDEYFMTDLAVRGPFAAWSAAGRHDTTALARSRAEAMGENALSVLDSRRAEQLAGKLTELEQETGDA